MEVELGPVPSPAVMAWVNYCRQVLDMIDRDPGDFPEAVRTRFAQYLDEWNTIARRTDPFRYRTNVPPESAEFLITWLQRTGERVEDAAEEGIVPLRPPEADRFHYHVVHCVLDALAREGPANANFVEELRASWRVARESIEG